MNRVFVDTSAFIALLNPLDGSHSQAGRIFAALQRLESVLVASSYALVETYALVQRRLGLTAVREFRAGFGPLVEVVWVDDSLHERGLDLLLDRGRRSLSLVDAVSFLIIRESRIDRVFAFDDDFSGEGFELLS